ncbi:probable RNA-binding protein EIF1AD [Takifugu rubripes]|uniref:Probable RNA-binding protein EIF1AD n=1 Tax=Takifugu rubripes TaxID=31033 RepID=A0A674N5Z7_TAKRU|nr:probable RNA-binding protein EIF1AD [Takifugu rubripes]
MSQATKRKHVVKEVLGDFVAPTEDQQIVKIVGSRGNNLHEVLTSQGDAFLVSMPTKFRKNIWIKRGDFVIVDPIEEGEKVKAEISSILYKDHVQHLKKQQQWPEGFMEEQPVQDKTNNQQQQQEDRPEKKEEKDSGNSEDDESESEDDESDLFVNTNRCNYQYESEEDDDDSEEEEDK